MKINSLAILKATSKLMLAGAVLLLSDGCSDKCKKITCYNGGFCNDGICSCQTGYEGDDCTMEVRAKFLGTYNVNDHCTITGDTTYTVNVAAAADEVLEVEIANFNNDFSNPITSVLNPFSFPFSILMQLQARVICTMELYVERKGNNFSL